MAGAASAVMLVLTVVTGPGQKDVMLRIEKSTLQECLAEAGDFLRHKAPDSIGAKKLAAGCIVVQDEDEPGEPS